MTSETRGDALQIGSLRLGLAKKMRTKGAGDYVYGTRCASRLLDEHIPTSAD